MGRVKRAAWPAILALKQLGVPLGRMAGLLTGKESLAGLLALQERLLETRRQEAEVGLRVVRTARVALDEGEGLSTDDLTALVRSVQAPENVWTPELDALARKHFTAAQRRILIGKAREATPDTPWSALIAEAERLADADPSSEPARDLALRWLTEVGKMTGGDRDLHNRSYRMASDVRADPALAAAFGISTRAWDFIHAVVARARSEGRDEVFTAAALGGANPQQEKART